MTKSESKGFGALIVIGVIAYPFVWLHEKIGSVGLVIFAVGVFAAIVYSRIRTIKSDQKEFEELVLYTLHNKIPPDQAKAINKKLATENFARSSLIRNLQIIRDSIEISLTSKKRDTAESRAQSVTELHKEIQRKHATLVSEVVLAEIDRVCSEAISEFNTKLFINIANGHIEKANSLKTNKSKIKYLDLAAEILEEGIVSGHGDSIALQRALVSVKTRLSEITHGEI
ncbi:hypothetical protein GBN33_03090 [Plesiomonas shigelloides]|uniref:hypothetical protein n=1 Tax=Plesiomonas shigelloides TaxID=703 RepID=UPI001261E4C3|nr:hypothetical protein [Plesiomonas shigelloides]KAB7702099.1 hypothetical protein GBN33_03090 [Plesiomonas shigelloides]